jgi:hypothetical protein
VYRAVVLTTLTLLLLAIAGITVARESTFSPEWDSQTESTVQDLTTTTMEPTTTREPTATTTGEPTDAADEETTEESEPAAGSVIEESTEPEADEPEISEVPEVTEEQATEGQGEKVVRPEGVGKPKGVGGKHLGNGKIKDEAGEANGGEAQEKVTLCHKGKTLMVGEPAQAAHVRHGDTVGSCPEGAVPGPPEEKPGPGVAQNGDGGNGQHKIMLCHKGKTLTVGEPAKEAHLRHGDTLGACG